MPPAPSGKPTDYSPPPARVAAGIFLISAATLLLQVTFIRIFSACIWYHFAFLVVSIALLGFGASGVALALLPKRGRDPVLRVVAPALFAITAVGAYLGTVAVPFSPFLIFQKPVEIFYFLLYDLFLLIPFFFSGGTVALILRAWPRSAGRLYAFDLVGASCGTLLLFFALPVIGARGTVALAALLGTLAALFLAPSGRARVACGALAVLLAPLVIVPRLLPDTRLDETKSITHELKEPGAHLAYSRWNALARIDVVERPKENPTIFIDAAASTAIAAPMSAAVSRAYASAVAFQLYPHPSVAVIGPGGGTDVQNALALGAREVTAVEINPVIIDLVTHRYADHDQHVFENPRVHLVRDEGRSFMERSRRKFDIIEITLIDTWAASVSGAYSLSENYLYTTEGIASYFSHLEPGGCLSITRWDYEMPRLVSLVRAALGSMGVTDPSSHVAVVQQGVRLTVLMKRDPFTESQAAVIRDYAARLNRAVVHDPLSRERRTIFDALLLDPDARPLFGKGVIALAPVSDESPFFFQMARWRSLPKAITRLGGNSELLQPLGFPIGQIVLLTALVLGLVLSVVLLAVPIAANAVPREERWRWFCYFFALGLAYIIVEVVLMQHLALFLGHPTYSVTTVLFAILLFSGLGSAWSDRRAATPSQLSRMLTWGLAIGILFVAFATPPIVHALIGLHLPARMTIAMAIVAPLAFLMGMPFPLGIRVLGARGGAHIPWAWAANGCGSVLGSVCAVLGAMLWNFSTMLMVAGVIYAGAMMWMMRLRDVADNTAARRRDQARARGHRARI